MGWQLSQALRLENVKLNLNLETLQKMGNYFESQCYTTTI